MTARIVMVSVGLLGVLAFIVIAELGINAGLIHYGVKIGHLDVGGMTPREAERLIEDVGREMASTPIVFRGGGLGPYSWTPSELDWEPRKVEMSRQAMDVGRTGNLFRSLADRVKSWTGGIRLRWSPPDRGKVELVALIVAQDADETTRLTVDEAKLESLIIEAVWDWPRARFYEIPFES